MSETVVVGLYGRLIGLYPREFRDEYGIDMVQLFRDQCADESTGRVFGRAVIDLAFTIPTQHLEVHMTRESKHLVPLLYTALTVAGLLLAVAGGSNRTTLIVGLCIAIVGVVTAVTGWRRAAPVGGGIATDSWWKLAVAGPCIVISVIVAAGLGVDAWFVGLFALLVAAVLTCVGVLLGLSRLFKRPTPRLEM